MLNSKLKLRSSPRKRGPRLCCKNWVPASAGTNEEDPVQSKRALAGRQRALHHRKEVGGAGFTIIRSADPHRVAGVIALVMQHALAELGAGGVPGKLEQTDPLLGLDAGAFVIARDVRADCGAQVGLGRTA